MHVCVCKFNFLFIVVGMLPILRCVPSLSLIPPQVFFLACHHHRRRASRRVAQLAVVCFFSLPNLIPHR